MPLSTTAVAPRMTAQAGKKANRSALNVDSQNYSSDKDNPDRDPKGRPPRLGRLERASAAKHRPTLYRTIAYARV
jgi:hypothetical protein